MQTIVVFTDGACRNNGKQNAVGGMGVHFPDAQLADISKSYPHTNCTNQKTELLAIYLAIRAVSKKFKLSDTKLIINTDSMYAINCITKWVHKWIQNDWITSQGRPVLNSKYIKKIYAYYAKYHIKFQHVPAHTGGTDAASLANAQADKLATSACKTSHIADNNQDWQVTFVQAGHH